MTITESRSGSVLIASPSGYIDSTTSSALENRLLHYVSDGERRLVLDFGEVEYISSAGLRVLLGLARRLRDVKGTLVLCALGEPVRQVFELAGFLPLFSIESARNAAVSRASA